MNNTDIPVAFTIPFANGATGTYKRQVPTPSQIGVTDGAASMTDGFPPLTFTNEGAGGVPPDGRDVNGILYQATAWARWIKAGALVTYDSAFATAIGGYPKYAVLASTTPGILWQSTVNANTANPDSGGANWKQIAGFKATLAQAQAGADDTTFLTPNVLASLFGTGSGESVTMPGGRIEKVGRVRTTLSAGVTYSVNYATSFPTGTLAISLTGVNSSASGTRDNWPQIVSETADGFTYIIQSSNTGGDTSLSGIDWIAKGY